MSQEKNKIIKQIDQLIQTSRTKLSQSELKLMPLENSPTPYKQDYLETYRQHQQPEAYQVTKKKKQYQTLIQQHKILQFNLQKKISVLTGQLNKEQLKNMKPSGHTSNQNQNQSTSSMRTKILEYEKKKFQLVGQIEENIQIMELLKKQNFQLQKAKKYLSNEVQSNRMQISQLLQQKIKFQQEEKNLRADLKATLTYIQQLKNSIDKNKEANLDQFRQRQIRVIKSLYKDVFPYKEVEEQVKIMETMTKLGKKILIDQSLQCSQKLIRSLNVQLKNSMQKLECLNNQNKYLKQRLESFDSLKHITSVQSQIIQKIQQENADLSNMIKNMKYKDQFAEVRESQLQKQEQKQAQLSLLQFKLENNFKTSYSESSCFMIGKIRKVPQQSKKQKVH